MTQEITDEQLQQANQVKKNWIQVFKKHGEEGICELLQEAEPSQIVEQEFLTELKTVANKEKSHQFVENLETEIKERLGRITDTESFDLEKYQDLNKARISQEMADYAIHKLKIRPVDEGRIGESKKYYRYNENTGKWYEMPRSHLGRVCKDMAGKEHTMHLRREFIQNMADHSHFLKKEELGLPDNEILLNNKRVLMLDTEPPYDTRAVKPEDKALHKLNVSYRPDADCPKFKEFVEELFDGKQNQIDTLQEYMGWLLEFPNRDWKRALIILGVTNSGKSQLTDIIEEFFTDQSVSSVSLNQLGMERRFHVNKLGDSVVNIDRDMSVQYMEGTDTIKQLISQEPMHVEPKNESGYNIQPTAKIVVCSNVSPKPSNQMDGAFYERFLTLKTPNEVPKEDRVPDFGKKLFKEESEGIFNWMLEGLRRLKKQGGFTLDPSPYETKIMWNEYGDSTQRFIWECVEEGDDSDRMVKDILWEEFEQWIDGKLMDKPRKNVFKKKVAEQPFISTVKNGGTTKSPEFIGLKVKTDSGNLDSN